MTGRLERVALEKITKKITNRYNRKPRGWNMLIDQRGNILIFSPRSSYMLRLIALGPDRYTGVGPGLQG